MNNRLFTFCSVVKEAPYQVAESGYGGFTLPIDIYLKNNTEPKKIRFLYELFLGVTATVSHNRCEKITFENPSEQFYARLIQSGGVGFLLKLLGLDNA